MAGVSIYNVGENEERSYTHWIKTITLKLCDTLIKNEKARGLISCRYQPPKV
ncbi:hypothetical protein KSX_87780 [Ktedonospora formicarum]|uniref:Uncharacterized protein n=1 Tax=Ktedonospora formicarum TaxID=2778364 RepID=A0A8J3MZB3_9CHLR|nr:hypothetical protein KSX_87780 [Ktedonospora formicarum]